MTLSPRNESPRETESPTQGSFLAKLPIRPARSTALVNGETLSLMRSSFWTPLFALDRLNSWLRAERPLWCPFRSAFKDVIYWTKTQAILDASKRWHIGMRRVMVRKPCRKCDASGSWLSRDYDWYDDSSLEERRANYGQKCWGCNGTGTAILKFIETTIGPIKWHTPAERWYMSSLDVYVPFRSYYEDRYSTEDYEEADGWEPLQKGRPMLIPDVERDLLLLLWAFPRHICFSIDFRHHTQFERKYGPLGAAQWIRAQFHPEEYRQMATKSVYSFA